MDFNVHFKKLDTFLCLKEFNIPKMKLYHLIISLQSTGSNDRSIY